MKKTILAMLVAAIIVVACAPKAAPVGSAAPTMPALASVSAAVADVSAGQTIFTTKCTKCHKAKDNYVSGHTYAEATGVLNNMSKKAKLSQEEINQLAAYVNSVAKK